MWLPEPIYKALPTLYSVIGAIFIIGVIYIGPNAPMGRTYLGIGLASILASITVTIWRTKHANDRRKVDAEEPQTD